MHLSGLFIYPIKSARGLSLQRCALSARGLCHDRRFMVVDERGSFLTQRTVPTMALLRTELDGDALQVHFQDLPTLRVPLTPELTCDREVRVFQDLVQAADMGEEAAAFLTRALGVPARLVYMPESSRRSVDPSYADPEEIVSFADGFPYLLASEASLADLNTRLTEPVSMRRFRPNLVVHGAQAYAEDGWRQIRIGGVRFDVKKPCTRCAITTLDPDTGERTGKDPLKTLAGYHTWQGKAVFAQNLIALDSGTIHVGDPLVVIA